MRSDILKLIEEIVSDEETTIKEKAIIILDRFEKDMTNETCKYIPVEWVKDRYPRREYLAECGFRFINMYDEVPDKELGTVKNHPKGKCMKCGRNIVND